MSRLCVSRIKFLFFFLTIFFTCSSVSFAVSVTPIPGMNVYAGFFPATVAIIKLTDKSSYTGYVISLDGNTPCGSQCVFNTSASGGTITLMSDRPTIWSDRNDNVFVNCLGQKTCKISVPSNRRVVIHTRAACSIDDIATLGTQTCNILPDKGANIVFDGTGVQVGLYAGTISGKQAVIESSQAPWGCYGIYVGAQSSSGVANTNASYSCHGAAYWCREAKGSNWFLPSLNEMPSIKNNFPSNNFTLKSYERYVNVANIVFLTSNEEHRLIGYDFFGNPIYDDTNAYLSSGSVTSKNGTQPILCLSLN